MRCHYEVLGLERDADDAQIKSAYRKLALRWHPDKNLDDTEGAAKEQFQLVQQAYEVLSDSHERAWYDNHREQILRGGHTEYEDNSLDVYQYFSASCYKGFDDAADAFYAVYAGVFDKIASEDIEFMDTAEEFEAIPKFGTAQSGYDEVVNPFYTFWQSYCTRKSYAWLSTHNIADIRDRRILKIIEKENKKVQQKARKDRNDEIRALVAFVRKRDKRVQAYKKIIDERAALNRVKAEQMRLEQIKRRRQEIEEQQKSQVGALHGDFEAELKRLERNYADEYGSESDEDDSTDTGSEDELPGIDEPSTVGLFCVACNKAFQTDSSFDNHEASKKHRDKVEQLRVQMRKDDVILEHSSNDDASEEVIVLEERESANDASHAESESDTSPVRRKRKNKKTKKKGRIATVAAHNDETDDDDNDNENDNDAAENIEKDTQPSPCETEPAIERLVIEDNHSDDWANDKKNRKGKQKSKSKAVPRVEAKVEIDRDSEDSHIPAPKLSAKAKKANRLVQQNKSIVPDLDPAIVDGLDMICATCKLTFTSRNKLFAHLDQTKHSSYLGKLSKPAAAAKRKAKKQKE